MSIFDNKKRLPYFVHQFFQKKKALGFFGKDMIIILNYLTKLCERDKINIVLNIWQKHFLFPGRLYREGGREGKGKERNTREREREEKSGAVPAALQFCCMPTQRWRWRPWRVLRQATGAVEAVPPDTGHLIPRLLFFYRYIHLLRLPLDLSWLAVTDIHDPTASYSSSPSCCCHRSSISFFFTISLMLIRLLFFWQAGGRR